jgi:phosphoglycolate phosphatase
MSKKIFEKMKLIIFDLDGTLLDAKADITDSINRTLAIYSLRPLSRELVWSYLGDGAAYLVNRCFGYYEKDVPPGAAELFVKDYENHCLDNSILYPGIKSLLKNLGGFQKAVLTNKTHEIALKVLEGMEIRELFDFIIGGRAKIKKKPDPQGILLILETLKIKADEAVIIGDTVVDMNAGMHAGIKRIAVTWGVHPREILLQSKPDAIVDSARGLGRLFL